MPHAPPKSPLSALDTVWFQLTGTLCNLACRHCFITCGPNETRVPMMDAADVRRFLDEAEALGARDYYFTGGEPMMHPRVLAARRRRARARAAHRAHQRHPLDDDAAARARRAFDGARYSFDLRVSLDGMSADENDPVRGKGTFDTIVAGIRALARVGLSPAITVVEHRAGMAPPTRRAGLPRVRAHARPSASRALKFLPLLRIGREPRRTRGYGEDERRRARRLSRSRRGAATRSSARSSRLVTPLRAS